MEIEAKRRNLGMHKQSRTLTKPKPKIRIIHLYAPEIIKTDASNFRELVQKLTGKPELHHHHHELHKQKGLKKNTRSRGSHHQVHDMNKNHGGFSEEEEEEEEILSMTWSNKGHEESSGGFLNGLGDLDGFIQELGEFPYLPLTLDPSSSLASSSHLHDGVFAESHQFA